MFKTALISIAAATCLASSASAATVGYTDTVDWVDAFGDREYISGVFFSNVGDSVDIDLTVTNSTSETWHSFLFETENGAFEAGSFSGAPGMFAVLDNGVLDASATIGGITVAPGQSFQFSILLGDLSYDPSGFVPFFGTPSTEIVTDPNVVPVPAAAWLLAGGVAALGALRRRKA